MLVRRSASAKVSRSVLRPNGKDSYGLVVLDSGSSTSVEECTVAGGPGRSCKQGLVATEKAELKATGCDIGGCLADCVVAKGDESRLQLSHCRVHDTPYSCVWVSRGASAGLDHCEVWGAKGTGCVLVEDGASGVLNHCKVWAATLDCVCASGVGASATAVDCELRDAERAVVHANEGARVALEGATRVTAGHDKEGQQRCALKACEEGSVVRLVGEEVEVQGREVKEEGGSVEHPRQRRRGV